MNKGKTLGMVKDDVFNKFWFELPPDKRTSENVKTQKYHDEVAERYAEEVVKDRTKDLVEMLELLDRVGGLGHDRHERIRNLINKHKTGQQ